MDIKDRRSLCSGASPKAIADDIEALVRFQAKGLTLEELSRLIEEKLIPHFMDYDRPEFQSFFNAFPEPGAEFGARVALKYNQGVTNWNVSPGGAVLEELCGKALCRLFGLAAGSDATFMYSGTYANQQAIYMALHRHAEDRGFDLAEKGLKGFSDPGRLAVVTSGLAHFSFRHAVRILGLGGESLIAVPVDRNGRLDAGRLKDILNDLKSTKDVFCLGLTAGTTSTGSVDPVLPVVEMNGTLKAWLHVDGAYGLAYSLVPEYHPLFAGIELADSVVWDPHKQMGVPIPNSLLFVRRGEDFGRMAVTGEYFNRKDDIGPNPGLKSAPSTRPLSALPLVASLLHQGLTQVIERLRAPVAAIRATAARLAAEPDIELCHAPDTGVLCWRLAPPGFPGEKLDRLQIEIHRRINAEGRRSISVTRLGGATVLRLVSVSPRVTEAALWETISDIRAVAGEAQAQALSV
jgi:L-2,4-diaminobutyrate decarboxylase